MRRRDRGRVGVGEGRLGARELGGAGEGLGGARVLLHCETCTPPYAAPNA